MAINRWLGTATAVAQVDTVTPANVEISDIFTLTLTGYDGSIESVSYTAAAATVADVTAGLTLAWNNSTATLISGITAVDNTTTISLTADVPGVAFSVAGSTTDGGGADTQTLTVVTATSNGGPNDWQSGDNWSLGTVPGETVGEDVYIENSTVSILYGLDNTGATNTIDSVHIVKNYTGNIGVDGAGNLIGTYLQIKTSKLFIGEFFEQGTATGSSLMMIDTGSVACEIVGYDTGISNDSSKAACRLLANNATSTNITDLRSGTYSVAAGPDETASINNVTISYNTSQSTDATLTVGRGVTMGVASTLTCLGGNTQFKTAVATILSRAGTLTISGEGAISTLNVDGGNVKPLSTGTITTCNITAGVCDFTPSAETRTVTTLTLQGGTLQYDAAIMSITNKVSPPSGAGRVQYFASRI